MARIRYLKPDFFKDDDVKNLPYEIRIFFAGLWCQADKEGRLEDKPERLKVEIMPYDKVDVEIILQELSKSKPNGRPFITRYQINNGKYIQIWNWQKHQKPHHTEAESIIPPPPGYLTVKPPLVNRALKGTLKGKGSNKGKKEIKDEKITGLTCVQLIVEYYKIVKKFDKIENWNEIYFTRFVRDAQKILKLIPYYPAALKAIERVGKYFEKKELDWNLSTVVGYIPEYLKEQKKNG